MSEDIPTQRIPEQDPVQPSDPGSDSGGGATKSKALLITLISVGGALLLAVIVLLVVLLTRGGAAPQTLPTPSSSETASSPSPTPSEAEGPSPTPTPAPSETEEAEASAPPPSNDPKINSFTLSPKNITCHVSTADAPYENPPYELAFSWSSSNAEEVYFGIDSPGGDASTGPYDSGLPANGTAADFSYGPPVFTCPTSAGSETHHYTLTITGHGKKVSKTVDLKVTTG